MKSIVLVGLITGIVNPQSVMQLRLKYLSKMLIVGVDGVALKSPAKIMGRFSFRKISTTFSACIILLVSLRCASRCVHANRILFPEGKVITAVASVRGSPSVPTAVGRG